jgi:Protein of unknown function (DUF3237)
MNESGHDRGRRAILAMSAAALALSQTGRASAQTPPVTGKDAMAPTLDLALTIWVQIAPLETIGDIPGGQGRIVPITGGEFEGPRLKGKVAPGGADWQTVRPDGVTELRAHYGLRTDDGALIQVQNYVLARIEVPASDGKPAQRKLRGVINFTAPKGPHDWLNKTVFVSTLNEPGDARAPVVIRAFSAG